MGTEVVEDEFIYFRPMTKAARNYLPIISAEVGIELDFSN
jgi:hypothetical protein